jgi:hypothetical protein
MTNVIFLTGHTYIGCFDDARRKRTLPYFQKNDDSMTNEYCADHCCSQSQMVTYMGTEVYINRTTNILKPIETELWIKRNPAST